MRITGGELKGQKIIIPKNIRVTRDKVRQAIFNIIGDKIIGARFIDLFAGSGSVGIEALSRGAKEVVFVEISDRVINVLRKNLIKLNCLNKAKIIKKDANKINIEEFDIVFADPPYNRGYVKKLENKGAKLLIIEHSKKEKINVGRQYKYGDTILTVIENENY